MSEEKPKQPPAKVPDGRARFFTTRQMPPNAKGFVGFETVWEPFRRTEYRRQKKP
jgi:hypothetical protein